MELKCSFDIFRLSLDTIGIVLVKRSRNVDAKSVVHFGSGEDEVMMPFSRLSWTASSDSQFVSSRSHLVRIQNMKQYFNNVFPYHELNRRTVFISLRSSEWLPQPRMVDITSRLNDLFRWVATRESVRIVDLEFRTWRQFGYVWSKK